MARAAPEDEAAGKRQQVQCAGAIGLANRRGELREGIKRQQIFYAAKRISRLPEKVFRPRRKRIIAPIGKRLAWLSRHDAEARAMEIGQLIGRLVIDSG